MAQVPHSVSGIGHVMPSFLDLIGEIAVSEKGSVESQRSPKKARNKDAAVTSPYQGHRVRPQLCPRADRRRRNAILKSITKRWRGDEEAL